METSASLVREYNTHGSPHPGLHHIYYHGGQRTIMPRWSFPSTFTRVPEVELGTAGWLSEHLYSRNYLAGSTLNLRHPTCFNTSSVRHAIFTHLTPAIICFSSISHSFHIHSCMPDCTEQQGGSHEQDMYALPPTASSIH